MSGPKPAANEYALLGHIPESSHDVVKPSAKVLADKAGKGFADREMAVHVRQYSCRGGGAVNRVSGGVCKA